MIKAALSSEMSGALPEHAASHTPRRQLLVTHLKAYFPGLVVFDGVEHVMGILTGIWNIEQETR
jgi:hypothetical protein